MPSPRYLLFASIVGLGCCQPACTGYSTALRMDGPSSPSTGDAAAALGSPEAPNSATTAVPVAPDFGLPPLVDPNVAAFAATVRVVTTTGDQNLLLAAQPNTLFAPSAAVMPEAVDVVVDTAQRLQTIVGFGGGYHDADARAMGDVPYAGNANLKLYADLFNPDVGLGLNVIHSPLGSSEFSSNGSFSFDDHKGVPDPNLSGFSMYFNNLYIFGNLRGIY